MRHQRQECIVHGHRQGKPAYEACEEHIKRFMPLHTLLSAQSGSDALFKGHIASHTRSRINSLGLT